MSRRSVILLCCYLFPLFVTAQRKSFSRLLPHYAKLQFAGDIGFLSGGFGYETNNKKIQADLSYGYVPEKLGGIRIHSLTGKFTWLPVSRTYKNNTRWDILTAGVYINYVFGKQYFFLSPENYPLPYYGLPTAAHAGFFIGEGFRFKRMALYYELGTNDKDLGSYVRNVRALRFTDILNVGIGVRYSFMSAGN